MNKIIKTLIFQKAYKLFSLYYDNLHCKHIFHLNIIITIICIFLETLLLHKAIKSLTIEISMQSDQIRQLKNSIEQILGIKTNSMTVDKFFDKHNLTLKLSNLAELKDFEKKLSVDKECLSDLVSLNSNCF